MKKFLVVFVLLITSLGAKAEFVEIDTNVNMENFWEKNGKEVQKVLYVGAKIANANKLNKRVVYQLARNNNIINACALGLDKSVHIYSGLLPYLDNDDELAYIIGHEMAHCMDFYDGPLKLIAMRLNPKTYETKADLIAIDLMVKAGYNPVAAICAMNKISGESLFDFWVFTSHPKGSKRLLAMYEYVYKKYPWALKSDMVHNVNYENFTYSEEKEIRSFHQKEKERASKKIEDL